EIDPRVLLLEGGEQEPRGERPGEELTGGGGDLVHLTRLLRDLRRRGEDRSEVALRKHRAQQLVGHRGEDERFGGSRGRVLVGHGGGSSRSTWASATQIRPVAPEGIGRPLLCTASGAALCRDVLGQPVRPPMLRSRASVTPLRSPEPDSRARPTA